MRKYLGIIICFLLAIFFALDKTVLNKNLENPTTARIYIEGTQPKRSIHIEKSDAIFIPSSWCKDCVNNKTTFDNNTGHIDVQLSVKQPDTLTIMLMGEYFMIGDQKMPLFTTYKNFTVNGEKIFSKFENADTKNYYKYKVNMNAGETMEFSVDVQSPSIFATLKYMTFGFYRFIIALSVLLFLYFVIGKFVGKYEKLQKFDAIFVVIFGFLLFIPMMHISNADKNEQENRTLAPKPELFQNNDINQKFGTQFNDWFNDRFLGRNILVNFYKQVKYKLSDNLVIGDTHYVNKKAKWISRVVSKHTDLSNDKLNKLSTNLDKLKHFADKNKIKIYIMITPSKNAVYGKDIFSHYDDSIEPEHVQKVIDYVKRHNNIEIIYPYKELSEFAKHDMAFFKTDHHWTDGGAFVGYQQLMKQINKDFPCIHVLKENDFDYLYSDKVRVIQNFALSNGSEYNYTNLRDTSFFDTQYKYFSHKQEMNLETKIYSNDKENYVVRNISFDSKNKYNLAIFGDSFTENLEPIIPYSFKNTLKIYTWVPTPELNSKNLNIERFEQDILKNKTDVLVIVFSNIERLMYLYKD